MGVKQKESDNSDQFANKEKKWKEIVNVEFKFMLYAFIQ